MLYGADAETSLHKSRYIMCPFTAYCPFWSPCRKEIRLPVLGLQKSFLYKVYLGLVKTLRPRIPPGAAVGSRPSFSRNVRLGMMIRLLYLGYPRSSPALLLRYGKSEPQPRGVLASTRFTPVSPRDATDSAVMRRL